MVFRRVSRLQLEDLTTAAFLREDYSVECYSDDHEAAKDDATQHSGPVGISLYVVLMFERETPS